MPNYYVLRIKTNENEYVKNGRVAFGWSKVDFSKFDDAELLAKTVENNYYAGDFSATLRGRKKSEVKRIFNIKEGDIILVPCYKGFYIGTATGKRIYDPDSIDNDLANQIEVDFIKDKKNNNDPFYFSRGGKKTSLTTKLSVRGFTVLSIYTKDIISEIDSLINSSIKYDKDFAETERVANFENAELEDFKKKIKDVLSDYNKTSLEPHGNGFEKLLQELFQHDGYKTINLPTAISSTSADADILAIKESKLGDEFSSILYIQAKHYSGKSDAGIDQIIKFKEEIKSDEINNIPEIVRANKNNIKYVLISSGDFTNYVYEKAENDDDGIILINGNRLAEMLYDVIDEIPEIRYKLGFVKSYSDPPQCKTAGVLFYAAGCSARRFFIF